MVALVRGKPMKAMMWPILLSVCVVGICVADELAKDRALLDGAPVAAARARDNGAPTKDRVLRDGGELDAAERAARAEANLALAKLDLVLARKALRVDDLKLAATKAQHVLVLLRQLPAEMDVSEYALQAEGILARAAKAGIDVDTLKRDATDTAPLQEKDRGLDRKVQGATRVARQYQGPPRGDVDTSRDARALRERTLRRQAAGDFGYRPGKALIDVDAILAADRERLVYQDALREAYKADEVRMLVNADEARLVPDDVVTYPADWPEKVKRREQYEGGMIARSESWYDKEGREWFVAVYDIHDLIYVPPDFGLYQEFLHPSVAQRDLLDRDAFWRRGFYWGGHPADTIAMLRYFGGVNPWVARGPKYSLERQREIVEMIQAFTGARVDDTLTLPPAP